MGKIVKYCAACEESFAEKFAFCPNCAEPLTAFEMNPVVSNGGGETILGAKAGQTVLGNNKPAEPEIAPTVAPAAPIVAETVIIKPVVPEAAPEVAAPTVGETKVFSDSKKTQAFTLADIEELENLDEVKTEETAPNDFTTPTKTFAAAAGANVSQPTAERRSNLNAATESDDGGYRITVIEEKNSKQRNALLLGTMVLMVVTALGGVVYSIFNKDLGIGAIDSGNPVFLAIDDVPPVEIEEPKPKANDDDGGGGGGGGKEEPEPPSKGRLVNQSERPITPPDAKVPQLTNPELKVFQETKGNIKRERTDERAGLPGSDNLNPSNGGGRGGGIGVGVGTGIGGGNGTGEGNGNGSGSGNGNGNGNGGGNGNGSGIPKPPPPPELKPVGPTEALKIISRPQPKYTDAARQNQVTGTVTLKVTFTASGQIGSVAPVNGLPYGLTEQAIAAAKQIRFEPPKRNGVPYAISKTVTYTFTIY